jgi:uncharacterized protein (TIGR02453 family)
VATKKATAKKKTAPPAPRRSSRPAAQPASVPLSSLPPLGPFTGFGRPTTRFLEQLSRHNDKVWFDAHREDYETGYLRPALEFIAALGPRLKDVSPGVQYSPRINGSMFRIQRDIRFSKDKTPYKAHVDLWFWHGDRKNWSTPGYFFRLEPGKLTLGAGTHRFEATQVEHYRDAVIDAERGSELEFALSRIEQSGPYSIGGASRKTVPKGYDSDHHRAHLLLHDGLFAALDCPHPKEMRSAVFVEWCVAHFENLAPLVNWLLRLG